MQMGPKFRLRQKATKDGGGAELKEGGREKVSQKWEVSVCAQEMGTLCLLEHCKLQNLLASPRNLFGSAGTVRIFLLVRPKKPSAHLVPRGEEKVATRWRGAPEGLIAAHARWQKLHLRRSP